MKRYIKDGIIKTRNQIVIKGQRTIKDKDGNEKEIKTQIINPREEMLLADGWAVYEEPKIDELVLAKQKAARAIEKYDSSSNVNAFYMQGQQMWLDKATRAGLMLRFQAEQSMGNEYTTLWYGSHQYELPLLGAFQMLYALEVYASQCYDNTQRHLAAIQELQTIEEVESYDYTVGYPEKLSF